MAGEGFGKKAKKKEFMEHRVASKMGHQKHGLDNNRGLKEALPGLMDKIQTDKRNKAIEEGGSFVNYKGGGIGGKDNSVIYQGEEYKSMDEVLKLAEQGKIDSSGLGDLYDSMASYHTRKSGFKYEDEMASLRNMMGQGRFHFAQKEGRRPGKRKLTGQATDRRRAGTIVTGQQGSEDRINAARTILG